MTSARDYARTILQKARDDQYAFKILADDPKVAVWSLGFHAQQAVEKALKSVLEDHSVEFPRTHNIAMLLELLRAQSIPLPPNPEELKMLTPFGVALRYEVGMDEEEIPFDRLLTKRLVGEIISWAEALLEEKPNS